MNDQYWSWLLSVVGVSGFILAGRKIWWAWYINIACQALWFTYAIVTQQWGFIVGAFFYTGVFCWNAYKWTMEHRYGPKIDFNNYALPPYDAGPHAEEIYLATKKQLDSFRDLPGSDHG